MNYQNFLFSQATGLRFADTGEVDSAGRELTTVYKDQWNDVNAQNDRKTILIAAAGVGGLVVGALGSCLVRSLLK